MSDHSRWTGNRRTFLKGTGVATIAGVAGCLDDGEVEDPDEGGNGNGNGNGDDADSGGDDRDENVVRFVLNPAEADVDIEQQYQPMFDYLEEETGAEIEAVPTGSYTETLQAIRNDHAEIADTSPSAAVAGADVADVVGVRSAFGGSLYFSTITTTPDSGIDSLEDLEGEEIYAGAPLSVSGTLVPMLMLKEAGLDVGSAPDGDPVDFTIEYGDHSIARNQMIQRPDVAAACTGAFSTAPLIPQEQFDEYPEFVEHSAEYDGAGSDIGADDADPNEELKLLAVSQPLPRAPLMARSNWDDPLRADIEEAILNVTEEDLQHDDDDDAEELWFTGVEEGSIEDYEPIRNVLDELGLEFEDLE